jgi:para-aminobenzoate synthetase component 1
VSWPDADGPLAWFGGFLATDLVEVSTDPRALDGGGWWAVVLTFEGQLTCARFDHVRPAPLPEGTWVPTKRSWTSSLSRADYMAAVANVRDNIAAGEVYQVNLCRVLSTPAAVGASPLGLARVLAEGNPAPYGGVVCIPSHEIAVVSASPELFLRRDGEHVESRPIKGTGRTPGDLREKDRAENVMIVDLVRNDLGVVCCTGSVEVPALCHVEEHPGLVHLVSTVTGRLRTDVTWLELLAAAFPPGSVSGAPKSSALRIISDLEPVERGPYCGAIGWIDADNQKACLAVGIRSFWWDGPLLRFGTGAGITWGSDAQAEWDETELKAHRLIALAGTKSSTVARTASKGRDVL